MLNKELRKALIDRDMKVQELAQKLGISSNYLSMVIHNQRPAWNLRDKIAEILSRKREELWKEKNEKIEREAKRIYRRTHSLEARDKFIQKELKKEHENDKCSKKD